MTDDLPPVLYKYTSAETARIVLESGNLRWSSPALFNDPGEFQRLPNFEPPLVKSAPLLPRLLLDAVLGKAELEIGRLSPPTRQLYELIKFGYQNGVPMDELVAVADDDDRPLDTMYTDTLRAFFGPDFINQARVLCLTANPLNPAMWANYASNSSGCVLGFRHMPEMDTPLMAAKRVGYYEDRPAIGSGLEFLLFGASPELRSRTIDAVCYAKRAEWQYEQEWRAVTWRDEDGAQFGDYPFIANELTSVIFGLKASDETVDIVKSLVSSKYPWSTLLRVRQEFGDLRLEQL